MLLNQLMSGSEQATNKMFWFIFAATVVGIVYYYVTNSFTYWTKKGVKQGSPYAIFCDNWGTLLRKRPFSGFIQYAYNMIPNSRYSGMYLFSKPALLIKDVELIKQIGVKDFDHFVDHLTFVPEDCDPLMTTNLFGLTGQRWRNMRATLSPSFTSSKMRSMFALMIESSENFTKYFLKQDKDLIEVEMKDAFTRFTNDVIATTAFGIKVDSLEDKQNEFFLRGKEATDFTGFWTNMKFMGYFMFPSLLKRFKVSFMSAQVTQFFLKIVRDTIKTRAENNIIRPDMIHLLMEARKGNVKYEETESIDTGFATVKESDVGKAKVKIVLEDIDIAAQAMIFFFAGFDTVSTLMCFTLYELGVNPDIQKRLREEIEETLEQNNGKLNYEALLSMKYMDMVVTEGLRKWPNTITVDRVCTKPYTIEPKYPDESPVHLKVNDVVWLPIFAIHHDPKYYPNPEKFDPERFSEENKSSVNPYAFIPFGVGPRSCVGSRFALLEIKAILFYLLHNFEIVPTEKTEIPLVLSKKTFTLSCDGGFWFGLKRITN